VAARRSREKKKRENSCWNPRPFSSWSLREEKRTRSGIVRGLGSGHPKAPDENRREKKGKDEKQGSRTASHIELSHLAARIEKKGEGREREDRPFELLPNLSSGRMKKGKGKRRENVR